MNIKKYYRKSFYRSLPAKSYLKLLLAIFFTFAALGFILDLLKGGQLSRWGLFIIVVYSGLLGLGYAHGVMRNWKVIPVVIAIQLSVLFLVPDSGVNFPLDNLIKSRLILDGLGIFITIILGYVFFIIFISGEGIRQVRMKTEMDLAKEMHDVLVPAIQYKNQRFEIYGKSIPTSEVGGDLLDLFQTGSSITCYIADVSGHGVAAGLIMGMFKSAMHTALGKGLSLSTILNTVNKSLHRLKKASVFLTASTIRFDKNNTAEFSVAGHLPILHYQASNRSVQHLTIKQIPLCTKPDYEFITKTVNFAPGDLFIFLTDGLTEVHNSKDEEFGLSRIEEIVTEYNSKPIDLLFDIIVNEVQKHGPQRDDQTLMIIRCF